jgi:ribose/xylose/arabinose/galactoside ABC-type transport system permease subunit
VKAFWRRPSFGPLVALVLTYGLFVVLAPDTFARTANLVTMARQTVIVAIAAVGMTFVIISGGIDLSVGSAVALTTVVTATLLRGGSGTMTAALGGVLASATAGLASGALVTSLRMTPFIVTLGAMSILRGLAKGIAHEQKIDVDPGGLESLLAPSGALLPSGVWAAIGVAVAGAFVLHFTRFGRHVFAVGSNEDAARLCGIRIGRTKILVYLAAGALAGLAGLMEFSTLTVGDPTDSIGLELEVIAAVVIGGASLAGGEGSIAGSMAGACLMTVIRTGGTHVGLPGWVEEIVTGAIIVVAVAVDRLRQRSKSRA